MKTSSIGYSFFNYFLKGLVTLAITTSLTYAANPSAASLKEFIANQPDQGKPKLSPNISIEGLPDIIKTEAKKKNEEMKKYGFQSAPDGEVSYLQHFPKMVKDEAIILPILNMQLANIDASELKRFKYEGIVPEGPTPTGPFTSVSRIYTAQNGDILQLFEWDFTKDGGQIQTVNEMQNETVNTFPAALVVLKSDKGNAITRLSWVTNTKYYKLTMTGHIRGQGLNNKLIDIASKIIE